MRRTGRLLLAWVALLAAAGCQIDLGEAPFLCHDGVPECPEGYVCAKVDGKKICVKEGSQPPILDGAPPSEGGTPDGQPPIPDGPRPEGLPPADGPAPAGNVIITEFMANPKAVQDTDGEWIELFNMGGQPVDINGWTLKDQGSDSHVIQFSGPLVVPVNGYLLIGRTTDKLKNGGVNVLYAYADFFLANTEDEVVLQNASGTVVDSFTYSAAKGFVIPDGASLSVKHPGVDKNNASNWCAEVSPWPGSKGDNGTPGTNPGCP
jgi:hypothetical protein